MEIVVLPPHDCLQRHYNNRRLTSPTKSHRNPRNPNRRRQTSNSPPPPSPCPAHAQIRILKPGDPVMPLPVVGSMIDAFYAGSACVTSPPPSELPLPAFFMRSCGSSEFSDVIIKNNNNQKIASDLRRVLKLC